MPGPRHPPTEAAEALISVAPLVSRWIERLLAGHEPPMTVAQFLALRAIAAEGVSGSELARRAGVSGPAVSQLVAGLVDADLLARHELAEDRRRHALVLTDRGEQVLASAQMLLRERLGTLLADLPRPEADALARALPRVEATSLRRAAAAPTAAPASAAARSPGSAAPAVTGLARHHRGPSGHRAGRIQSDRRPLLPPMTSA